MKKAIIWFIKILPIGLGYAILAFIAMYAWNGVIPCIFNLSVLSYTQALCLLILIRVIAVTCYTRNID